VTDEDGGDDDEEEEEEEEFDDEDEDDFKGRKKKKVEKILEKKKPAAPRFQKTGETFARKEEGGNSQPLTWHELGSSPELKVLDGRS